MPLFPACTTGNTMLIGIDAHSTAIPPVPLNPHPFVGVLMLWTSPKFPMSNVMINGSPACCSGAKGYSIHIPQGTWVDIPKVTFKVWYITNLITVGFVTLFTIAANIMIAVVKGIASSLTDPKVSASKAVWDNITGVFTPFTQWQTWAQMLIPPLPLPGAEGNAAIGSPTVSVNGGSMALGVPLGGASCSEIPIVPNATVIAFSHVQVGMTFAQLMEAFITNAITATAAYAGSRAASRFVDRNRCRLGLEPIDLVTGSNFEDKTDFELGGPLRLSWKRYYASTLENDGPLGWNWSHEYQRWLEFRHATIVYHNEQNRSIVFPALEKDGESHFLPFDRFTLTRQSETQFTVTTIDGEAAHFTTRPKADQAWITSFSNRAGEAIGFRYDPKGRLHEIVHSTGQRIKVDTQNDGRITRLSLACSDGKLRPLVAYEYDDHGDLVAVVDAAGKRAKYIYDDRHQMTRKTDRNGYSFHYAYDRNGRCISSRGDDDLYAGAVEYMPPAKITILQAPTGGKIIYRYDERGLIISRMDPYGGVQLFEYDKAGNKVAEVDETGSTRKYKYDDFGNAVEETNPFGGTTKRVYNKFNLKAVETDPDGNTTKYLYDARGNLLGVIDPTEAVTIYEYDSRNRRTRTIESDGRDIRFQYDDGGRLIGRYNASGALSACYRYDDWGHLIEQRDGSRRVCFHYDDLGRLVETVHPDGSVSTRQYDVEGNLIGETDSRRRNTRYDFSSWNQCIAMRLPGGQEVRYAYNKADELVSVTDGAGHRTQYERDLKDRITSVIIDDVPIQRRIHDAARNVTQVTDADAQPFTTREFGPGGFKVKEDAGQSTTTEFKPDAMGRIVAATGPGEQIEIKHDPQGHVLSTKRLLGSIEWKRDVSGRTEQIKYSEGLVLSINYAGPGTDCELTDPLGDSHTVSGLGGGMQSHVFPNGWVEVRALGKSGTMTWHLLERKEDRARRLLARQYINDGEGNRLEEKDWLGGPSTHYNYDHQDRIVSADRGGRRLAEYRYDAAGNVTPTAASPCEFGIGNRLNRAGDSVYSYDSRGCPVGIESPKGRRKLSYDGNGHLIKIQLEDGRSIQFGYDALGRRIWKELDGQRVTFHYDAHRLMREIHGDDYRRIYFYLDGADSPFMFVDLRRNAGGDWDRRAFYVHSDDIGLARTITDREGHRVWSCEPEPYGEGIVDESQGVEYNLRYPGQYFDRETGWRYNGFRYYDPATARFLEPDPLLLGGGFNIYAYPANPWRQVDRDGLSEDCGSSTTPRPAEEETPVVPPGTPIRAFPPLEGLSYAHVVRMLEGAGYVQVREPTTMVSPRSGNLEEVSGIWMMRTPDGTTHVARVDPWGHAESLGPAGLPPHVHRSSIPSGSDATTPLGTGGTGMSSNEQQFLQPRNNVPTTNYTDGGDTVGPRPPQQPGESNADYGRRLDREYFPQMHTPIDSSGAPPRPDGLPPHPQPEMLQPAGGGGGTPTTGSGGGTGGGGGG